MEQIELLKGLLAVGYEKNSKDNKGETNAQNIIKENSQ